MHIVRSPSRLNKTLWLPAGAATNVAADLHMCECVLELANHLKKSERTTTATSTNTRSSLRLPIGEAVKFRHSAPELEPVDPAWLLLARENGHSSLYSATFSPFDYCQPI